MARKDIILLSDIARIIYKVGSRTGIEDRHMKFTLSVGTNSIDVFNAKVKLAVIQQRQYWQGPQIKNLKLVIPGHYTLMASNSFLLRLVHSAAIF